MKVAVLGACRVRGAGFWLRLLTWRWRSRGHVLDAVTAHTPQARLSILRTPTQVRRSLTATAATGPTCSTREYPQQISSLR